MHPMWRVSVLLLGGMKPAAKTNLDDLSASGANERGHCVSLHEVSFIMFWYNENGGLPHPLEL